MNPFIERYSQLGWDYTETKMRESLWVNTSKIRVEELKARLEKKRIILKKIPFLEKGFLVESKRFSLSSTQEYLQGFFHMQEAASQLPVQALQPKGLVLDMCAAPGGKTAQIALQAEAVVALESQQKRMQALLNNLERLGIKNCIAYNIDARKFEGVEFDKILLDAPCSGNCAKDRRWFSKQTISNFEKNSKIQKELLSTAYDLLKEGGEILYSTCSLEPEENELVVDWAIKNLGLKTMKLDSYGSEGLTQIFNKKLSEEIKLCKRIWPSQTQGFFMAKLKK
ncbi:RsmB/NOP family class I SAM-dependent RNA methyltransferase [Candidatus Woesearchaeota archaeon]|nr:RsmB/NOP family class I SAM-dependent RNA methyltransferase [Candidatus Woesearchaeota archaeon]